MHNSINHTSELEYQQCMYWQLYTFHNARMTMKTNYAGGCSLDTYSQDAGKPKSQM